MNNVQYKRNLIHIHPAETPLFVTFRLHNSIPGIVFQKFTSMFETNKYLIETELMSDKEKKKLLYDEQKKHFKRLDNYLHDESPAEKWLLIPEIGKLVHDKIVSYHEERYNLICSCVMPNHGHMLFEHFLFQTDNGKGKDYPVSQTMKYIKGATAREANLLIKKQGTFWQKESYDHYVRNDQELDNIIHYILNNPVKAGLIEDWTKWPRTFLAGWTTL